MQCHALPITGLALFYVVLMNHACEAFKQTTEAEYWIMQMQLVVQVGLNVTSYSHIHSCVLIKSTKLILPFWSYQFYLWIVTLCYKLTSFFIIIIICWWLWKCCVIKISWKCCCCICDILSNFAYASNKETNELRQNNLIIITII